MPAKKKPVSGGLSLAELNNVCRELNAVRAYLHGDSEKLSQLLTEKTGQVLSAELATFLSKIVRGEKLRGKGRPSGSRQDDSLTRAIIPIEIDCLRASGMTLEEAYEEVGRRRGRGTRTIRRYYEDN